MSVTAADRRREAIVARAEARYHDLELSPVREWKAARPGAKAVGFMPIHVPREIIHAAGMLPVGVMGGGDRLEVVRGNAYFQSYICHLPRSTIELGLSGALDPLDGMVFPSICDVIRNLSGMWQVLFPDRYVRYLDVPQNFDPRVGGAFYERELRSFAADLERLGGVEVTDGALRESIRLYNENRRVVNRLYEVRVEAPWRVPSPELYVLLRAANVLPVEEHTALLEAYLGTLDGSGRRPMDMARIVIRGCFCEQPPYDLVRTLERSGCYIVDDDWVLATRWIEGDVETDGDPITNLVRAFLARSPACPSMFLAEGRKGGALVRRVGETRAEGVLFAAPSFCDPALLDQPMTQAAVQEAKIPCTSFLYAENAGQYQVIREQAGTFADAIRLA